MNSRVTGLSLTALVAIALTASADDLTLIIQQDLVALGYDPGAVNGEMTTATIVAISKFQAEHDLEVTGEATPQLAGVIKASMNAGGSPVAAQASAQPAVSAEEQAAALRAAQQACLQEKAAAAQESQQRRRGLGRLARAIGRTADNLGGADLSNGIADLSGDIYEANAIASDFKGAAEDLGLTESDIEDCRNP